MFFIFKRWGLLVPLIFVFVGVAYVFVEEAIMGEATPENPGWGLWPVFLVTACILWPLGRRMNADAKRVVIDTETGEEIALDRSHSFFFVKVEYWAIPMLLLTAAAFAAGPPEYQERKGKKNQEGTAIEQPTGEQPSEEQQ